MSQAPSTITIYVGNLPLDVTEVELADLFSPYGEVYSTKCLHHRTPPCDNGFVEMTLEEGQQAIKALHDQEFQGCKLHVQQTAMVLTVEDSIEECILFNLLMRYQGYYSQFVQTGQDALQHFRTTIPDICLIELNLPDLDGLEVVKLIQNIPELNKMGVILMRAGAFNLELGPRIDAQLFRPIVMRDIEKQIKMVLTKYGKSHLIVRRD